MNISIESDVITNDGLATGSSDETVKITDEKTRWKARDADYLSGRWSSISKHIPKFELVNFKANDCGPSNPYFRMVVRQPISVTEQLIPVGVVSKTYQLAQHAEVVEMCLEGLKPHGIEPEELRCEVGLTSLGEWMNFRAYFPSKYEFHPKDGNKLGLRLECFNSVDGTSRLTILLSWLRLVCSNGLVISESVEVHDTHDEHLDLQIIPKLIKSGMGKISADLLRIRRWEDSSLDQSRFKDWVDTILADKWGKKAACRALHICRTGRDVEITNPFEGGDPSEKGINLLDPVPGAADPSSNLYDVCQALSWLATQRNNAEQRLEWQSAIPDLVEDLRRYLKAA